MKYLRGSLAPKLDFEELLTGVSTAGPIRYGAARTGLRLTTLGDRLRGPDKYKVLEHRRRRAQITARRALGLF